MSEQIDKIVYSLLENPIEDKKIDCQCFLNENQKELVLDASSVFVQNIIEQAKNSAVNIKNNDEFGMCLAAWYFDRVNNMTKKKLNLSHPTVYPLSMIVRIVKMATNPGDTVLDPFAGSGTSLVAAKIMGRNGIGFELDEKYREECMRRLETEGTMPASVFDEMNEDAEKK